MVESSLFRPVGDLSDSFFRNVEDTVVPSCKMAVTLAHSSGRRVCFYCLKLDVITDM